MTTHRLVIGLVALTAFLAPATVAHSLWSTTATATLAVSVPAAPTPTAPAAPTNVTCSASNAQSTHQVTLAWSSAGTGATFQIVDADSGIVLIDRIQESSHTFPRPLSDRSIYRLGVRAVSPTGSVSAVGSRVFTVDFDKVPGQRCSL